MYKACFIRVTIPTVTGEGVQGLIRADSIRTVNSSNEGTHIKTMHPITGEVKVSRVTETMEEIMDKISKSGCGVGW